MLLQDTLRDCAQDTNTCYNTVVSPLYFVSFVLTAQFVLVNVVIAVLMKHLEESNKEAKEEAELEAELELDRLNEAADVLTRSPQLNPLAMGMDRSSSGGSPWRSTGEGDREQERDGPMDSPTADIPRDSVNIREDPPTSQEPSLEVRNYSSAICVLGVRTNVFRAPHCEGSQTTTKLLGRFSVCTARDTEVTSACG